jgi:hypothetical protein
LWQKRNINPLVLNSGFIWHADAEDAEGHFKMAPGMYQYWEFVHSAVVYMHPYR